MTDIPANSSTTARISVGESTIGSLETVGDRDWFRIDLSAGQAIQINLSGFGSTPVEDTYLRVRDAAGNIIYENDDIVLGTNRDSALGFEAPTSGTYFIEVGSWNDDYSGGYQLEVSTFAMPPVGDMDALAQQLVSGYWGGDSHHFNVTQGGTLTVNLTALTAAGQNLAREALALWTDVIGVNFQEVSSGGQITFDDNEEGAFAEASWSGEITTSAHINISSQWLADYGSGLNSYSFQTYIHEIGHALGLGHSGNYNGDGQYPFDVAYQIDGWPASVMSYFDQNESSYWDDQGFTVRFLGTPMMADILAMAQLYGLSTTTRTGDTTYGFNSNANRDIFNASLYPTHALTIFDSGGVDTLNYSGYSTNQRIDLNDESFSNVGSGIGNLAIARGVIIENAIGGSGNDTLIGNGSSNVLTGGAGDDSIRGGSGSDTLNGQGGRDTLIGGAGNDTIRDTAASLNGDTITDFSAGDRIIITDASLLGFTFSLSGGTLTYSGGSLSLGSPISGTLVASAVQGGGVQLTIGQAAAENQKLDGSNGNDVLEGGNGNDWLLGLAGDDYLYGNGGNDTLDAGAGVDRMYGGAGDDSYSISDATDYTYENAGEGYDTVTSSVSHALRDNVEELMLTGVGNLSGRGNDGANLVTGNAGRNDLIGNGGDDRLYGEGGNDELTGGAGLDRLYGGIGNDVYVVSDATDYIYENVGEGYDIVYSSVDVALRVNIERLNLTGTAAIDGRGNDESNTISGNLAGNVILGQGGNDYLYGQGGDDRVEGGTGNDRLDGGSGLDRLIGGEGDDIYIVRDATDYIYENAGEGYDRVYSAVDVVLRANIERLYLTGSADIDGRGNDEGNIISGNSGANTILGQGGDDFLYGVDGNDTVYGGLGNDRVYGGDGDDFVNGGTGDDQIEGGAGLDLMYGELGADLFVFRQGDFGGNAPATADRILDFNQADGDLVHLNLTDANTTLGGDQDFAFVGTAAFTGAAGELRYEQSGGDTYVSGDTNGDGNADFVIRLDGLHTLESGDFLL